MEETGEARGGAVRFSKGAREAEEGEGHTGGGDARFLLAPPLRTVGSTRSGDEARASGGLVGLSLLSSPRVGAPLSPASPTR